MKKIYKMMTAIREELCSAMIYAEEYLMYKNIKPNIATMYQKMASDEINHANYLKEIGEDMVKDIAWVSEEDEDKWDKCIKKLADKEGMVKMMLSK